MIELLFLLVFLPRRMSSLARERGQSAFAWTLAAIGAWLGAEFVIIITWLLVHALGATFWGWSEDIKQQPMTIIVYILALIGGLVSADLVRRQLTSKPVIRDDVKPWRGIWS
jgi:uncharacterized protein YacL